jgi:hypothetical protein
MRSAIFGRPAGSLAGRGFVAGALRKSATICRMVLRCQ